MRGILLTDRDSYSPCRPSKVAMDSITQLQRALPAPRSTIRRADDRLFVGVDCCWAEGLGQSFGRSGSPLEAGPPELDANATGATMTVAVSVLTLSANRRSRM